LPVKGKRFGKRGEISTEVSKNGDLSKKEKVVTVYQLPNPDTAGFSDVVLDYGAGVQKVNRHGSLVLQPEPRRYSRFWRIVSEREGLRRKRRSSAKSRFRAAGEWRVSYASAT